MRRVAVPAFLIVISTIALQTQACEKDDMASGCRIYSGQCSCAYGCKSEFRYANMEKCRLALAGTPTNLCNSSEICLHGGTCLQTLSEPGFKCSCHGTGYFGQTCEKPCPGPQDPNYRENFPLSCVVV